MPLIMAACLAACCAVLWLTMLVATNFNSVAISVGLVGLLYVLGRPADPPR